MARGLHAQTVCQVEGLDSIIECRRAIVGGTGGMGQGAWVDGGYWAILIMDIGDELSVLGMLMVSTCLLAAPVVVASLSLAGAFPLLLLLDPPCCCCWVNFGSACLRFTVLSLLACGVLPPAP